MLLIDKDASCKSVTGDTDRGFVKVGDLLTTTFPTSWGNIAGKIESSAVWAPALSIPDKTAKMKQAAVNQLVVGELISSVHLQKNSNQPW